MIVQINPNPPPTMNVAVQKFFALIGSFFPIALDIKVLAAAEAPNGNAKNRFSRLQNITCALNYSLIFIDPIRIELISKQNTSTSIGNATVKQWEKYLSMLIFND